MRLNYIISATDDTISTYVLLEFNLHIILKKELVAYAIALAIFFSIF